jgi:hypothetical protein
MIKHDTPRSTPGKGYPWIQVKIGGDVLHFRIPGISLARKTATYYGAVAAAVSVASKRLDALKESDDPTREDIQAATDAAYEASGELNAALGFVLLTMWADPVYELRARTAWLQAATLRKALHTPELAEAVDADLLDICRHAFRDETARWHGQSKYGDAAWEELRMHGIGNGALQSIAIELVKLLVADIKDPADTEVQIVADF